MKLILVTKYGIVQVFIDLLITCTYANDDFILRIQCMTLEYAALNILLERLIKHYLWNIASRL